MVLNENDIMLAKMRGNYDSYFYSQEHNKVIGVINSELKLDKIKDTLLVSTQYGMAEIERNMPFGTYNDAKENAITTLEKQLLEINKKLSFLYQMGTSGCSDE